MVGTVAFRRCGENRLARVKPFNYRGLLVEADI